MTMSPDAEVRVTFAASAGQLCIVVPSDLTFSAFPSAPLDVLTPALQAQVVVAESATKNMRVGPFASVRGIVQPPPC